MNIQELIKKYEEKYETVFGFPVIQLNQILEDLKQLDEPQKPIVPQVVMDYYEFYRGKLKAFEEWFAKFEVEYDGDFQQMDEVGKWLYDVDFETQTQRELALAMLIVNGSDAVEVEKEKRYLVKIIGINDYYSYLNYRKEEKSWTVESEMEVDTIRTSHTRKELEKSGFGWVFNCPGVEVKEVK